MKKQLTNHDIPSKVFERHFSRDELRKLAAQHGIMRGRNRLNSAANIAQGRRQNHTVATFTITLSIP